MAFLLLEKRFTSNWHVRTLEINLFIKDIVRIKFKELLIFFCKFFEINIWKEMSTQTFQFTKNIRRTLLNIYK